MTVLGLTALVGAGSVVAGLLGALTGLGGGVVIVPLLVVAFGVDIRYAIGASLVSIIATSSGAAAAYVEEGYSNVRVALLLEIATALGALSGAGVAAYLRADVIAVVFGLVLIYSAAQSLRPLTANVLMDRPDPIAVRLRLDSSYPTPDGKRHYHVRNVPIGFRPDVWRRHPVRTPRHRVGCDQSAGDGSRRCAFRSRSRRRRATS